MKAIKQIVLSALSVASMGLATNAMADNHAAKVSDAEFQKILKASFKSKGQATVDRLEQTPLQKACSAVGHDPSKLDPKLRDKLQTAAMNDIKYPADGKFLGDWKAGEKVAQSGKGMQWSDDPKKPNGGNCYACHQLSTTEISYGNIGPSLLNYGKLRGNSEEIMKYTWGRIWNSHAFNACNDMPRFGAAGILTEQQIKDVMALLLDPESPVNK